MAEKVEELSTTISQVDPDTIYDLLEKMGEGSYGSVFKAKHKLTNRIVAVKMINLEEDTKLTEVRNEISCLQDCHHPNIVQYFGSYLKYNRLWVSQPFFFFFSFLF